MEDIRNTQLYKDIKYNENQKTSVLSYYVKTDVFVTEKHMHHVIDAERIEYNKKKDLIRSYYPDYHFDENAFEKEIEKTIKNQVNDYKLYLKFAYVNHETIDEVINEVENEPNFHSWNFD